MFEGREVNVAVETASPLTSGMTIVDWWGVTDRPPNARFMTTVDADGLYDLLTERLTHLAVVASHSLARKRTES